MKNSKSLCVPIRAIWGYHPGRSEGSKKNPAGAGLRNKSMANVSVKG